MRIKLNNGLLLGALCLSAVAQAEVADAPQDFAYGMPLTTDSSAPFFRVELPQKVYEQTAWLDLRDVRVFNGQGMTVPFALISDTEKSEGSNSHPLRIFPMNGKKSGDGDRPVISLKSASGIEVTLPADEKEQAGRSFLLELTPAEEDNIPRLTGLTLEWERATENWQAQVSVLYSNDLKSWRTAIRAAPLMDLASGDDRLMLNTLDLGADKYTPSARYYLIMVNDGNIPAGLNIRSALGTESFSSSEQRRITLNLQAKRIADDEAEYTWPSPQPLSRLSITPAQNNTVLPLNIEYRSSAQDSWRPLTRQVVYRLDGRTAAPIALHGQVAQGIRLKGINQKWNDNIPQVRIERDVLSLVFNAQGSPPFLLTWGNKAAGAQSIDIQALIPEALHQSLSVDALPRAGLEPVQVLGGAERLTATDAAERAGIWQKGLLWAVLILGAAGLVLLALKVWREVQKREM